MIPTSTSVVLYSAWFCPYAQRVWAALNHLQIQFELVESLTFDENEKYIKHQDLLRHNPKGLVPTLVIQSSGKSPTAYCDSLDILKKLYRDSMDDTELTSLYESASEWNKRICSQFYKVLLNQDKQESLAEWNVLCRSLTDFSNHLDYDDTGNIMYYQRTPEKPSLVDFAVFPFIHRLYIIQHYKGHDFADPKISAWLKLMEALPAVQKTLADRPALIRIYERYADGTAQSKVAESVRQGKNAHDV